MQNCIRKCSLRTPRVAPGRAAGLIGHSSFGAHRQKEPLHQMRRRGLEFGPADPHTIAEQNLQQAGRPPPVAAVVAAQPRL